MENEELFHMTNGKHKGELITRVPAMYLKWMINARHADSPKAEAELKRRGTALPDIEITGHATDRASLRIMKVWQQDRKRMPYAAAEEGMYSWLARRGLEAYAQIREGCDQVSYVGVIWTFELGGVWPVLKSVWEAPK